MLKSRMLVWALLASCPVAAATGQDLLSNLRQRLQDRAACCPCDCGAPTRSDCNCQNGTSTSSHQFSSNDCPPASFQNLTPPATSEMVPGSIMSPSGRIVAEGPIVSEPHSYQPPGLITPGSELFDPGYQPAYPGMSTDTPGPNISPNNRDNPNADDLGAAFGAANGNLAPPNSNANLPAAAAQDAGEGFSLTSQFAGRGEASGVRDLTIGDFFSGGGAVVNGQGPVGPITIPIAGGDRRRKVSDHFSPLPTNRTFFSYHGFGDAVSDVNGNQTDVQRFTFGLERMFCDNNASFEVRIPFEHGVSSQQVQDFSTDSAATGTEFGNITLATKYLLLRERNHAVSAGVASILPTASDARMELESGTLDVHNDAFDIIPFLAYHLKPTQNTWATLTTQLDFNVRGNECFSNQGTDAEESGRFNDQNLYSIDLSTGRWFWNDPSPSNRCLRGVAGIFELHYTTSINNTDEVDLGTASISNPFNRIDILNSTVGFRFLLGQKTFATLGAVIPLRTGDDRPFESEFNFNLSRLY